MNTTHLANLADQAYALAKQAGEKIMLYYNQAEPLVPEYKADHSPLTQADKAAHEIIDQGLVKTGIPVLSEEGAQVPFLERQAWESYWCVDPLDGTKDFLEHNDEFTVNIALVMDHEPVIGVIYVPQQQLGYMAWRGGGAYRLTGDHRERIVGKHPPHQPLRLLVSRHHGLDSMQPFLARLGKTELVKQGSALKFCTLASGEADVMVRLSPTSEWDNAAGHCILEEAGGALFTFNHEPIVYNRSGILEHSKFVAVSDKFFDWRKYF